jgi:putative ABC transport system substrate-binding protein
MSRGLTTWTRRQFARSSMALAGLSLLSGCELISVPGQQPASLRRVGVITDGLSDSNLASFREGMRDLGYVEGQNLLIEYRDAEGNIDRLPALAAELVSSRVEVIVARNNLTALAVSRATSSIPIVAAGADVVAAGLVTTIARPEGNLTGVTSNSVETVVKWIELLAETVPTMSCLGVVLDWRGPAAQAYVQQLEHAVQFLQIQRNIYDLRGLDRLPAVLATARADGTDSLVVVPGGVLAGGSDPRIGAAVLTSRLPAVAQQRLFAVSGGLLAHGVNTEALIRRSASYVDKILKGAKPGALPVELPTEFHIVVNVQSAQVLGITVPQSVLQQASEIIR